MATISGPAGSAAVKVRDLSTGGALIEGATLPKAGSRVRLVRGGLEVAGDVVWSHEGKAGLQFRGSIYVAEWLPKASSATHQHRVDQMVEQARRSITDTKLKIDATPVPPSQPTVAEIAEVQRALDSLAEDLCEDETVMLKHALTLQALDKASQLLSKLAAEGSAGSARQTYKA